MRHGLAQWRVLPSLLVVGTLAWTACTDNRTGGGMSSRADTAPSGATPVAGQSAMPPEAYGLFENTNDPTFQKVLRVDRDAVAVITTVTVRGRAVGTPLNCTSPAPLRIESKLALSLTCRGESLPYTLEYRADRGDWVVTEDGSAPMVFSRIGGAVAPANVPAVDAPAADMPPADAQGTEAPDAVALVTPSQGSPLRTAILDALRPAIERQMGAPVKFTVTTLQVLGTTALFTGRPIHVDGRPFSEAEVARAFGGEVYDGEQTMAWLVLRNGTWQLKEYLINQSDVGYLAWCKDRTMSALLDGACASSV